MCLLSVVCRIGRSMNLAPFSYKGCAKRFLSVGGANLAFFSDNPALFPPPCVTKWQGPFVKTKKFAFQADFNYLWCAKMQSFNRIIPTPL